jgi:hypothetical protein
VPRCLHTIILNRLFLHKISVPKYSTYVSNVPIIMCIVYINIGMYVHIIMNNFGEPQIG